MTKLAVEPGGDRTDQVLGGDVEEQRALYVALVRLNEHVYLPASWATESDVVGDGGLVGGVEDGVVGPAALDGDDGCLQRGGGAADQAAGALLGERAGGAAS